MVFPKVAIKMEIQISLIESFNRKFYIRSNEVVLYVLYFNAKLTRFIIIDEIRQTFYEIEHLMSFEIDIKRRISYYLHDVIRV